MAYAVLDDVKARAGVLAGAWTDDSHPSNTDIEAFLDQTAAEIDALLISRNLTPPAPASPAAEALLGMNADAALVLALEATYPEASGPASASKELDSVRARVTAASKALLDGTSAAIALLEATTSGLPTETSFWQKEPTYGLDLMPHLEDQNPYLAPAMVRSERF